MALSNEWWEDHLTTRGWVKGSERLDCGSTKRETPADRVLTIRHAEYAASRFSGMEVSDSTVFVTADKELLEECYKKYGNNPK